jgi:hypothetical protein
MVTGGAVCCASTSGIVTMRVEHLLQFWQPPTMQASPKVMTNIVAHMSFRLVDDMLSENSKFMLLS